MGKIHIKIEKIHIKSEKFHIKSEKSRIEKFNILYIKID
jgi:hypothetical protein